MSPTHRLQLIFKWVIHSLSFVGGFFYRPIWISAHFSYNYLYLKIWCPRYLIFTLKWNMTDRVFFCWTGNKIHEIPFLSCRDKGNSVHFKATRRFTVGLNKVKQLLRKFENIFSVRIRRKPVISWKIVASQSISLQSTCECPTMVGEPLLRACL